MELKRRTIHILQITNLLLIVPYGIETSLGDQLKTFSILLIVPYGIETSNLAATFIMHTMLLIVPYGIETRKLKDSVQ